MGHIQHKAQAGMLVAALLAAVLALPGAAFGLSTDKQSPTRTAARVSSAA